MIKSDEPMTREKLVDPMTFVEECIKDYSNYCGAAEDVPRLSPLLPLGL